MNKTLIFTLSLFASTTSAAGISDLNYIPGQGHFAGALTYRVLENKSSIRISNPSTEVSTSKSTTNTTEAKFAYGFTDQLSAGAELEYTTVKTDSTFGPGSTLNGQSRSSKDSGMKDAKFGAVYRFANETTGHVDADLTVAYSPKMGDSKSGTTKTEGNGYRGGDLIDITVQVAKKYTERISFSGSVEVQHYGTSSSADADTGDESVTDSRNQTILAANAQVKAVESLYLVGGLAHIILSSHSVKSPTQEISQDRYSQSGLVIGAKYEIVPQKFLVSLTAVKLLEASVSGKVGSTNLSGKDEATSVALSLLAEF